jgi:glyoxylase-like metal-dependent hydrolase (beta-lactamase superfamily II)
VGHVELAEGVHQLSVQPGINCWVVIEPSGTTLIDSGLDRKGLVERLATLGVAARDVTRVLLTHCHPDHAGGIRRLKAAGGSPSVEVGAADLDTVRGVAPQPTSDPTTRSGRVFDRLPPTGAFAAPIIHPEAEALPDAELAIAGGIRVLPTPGHTPGHVAYHLLAHDLVIGGDVLFNLFRLRPSPAFLCWQVPANLTSVGILADRSPSTLALAHGRPVTGDVAGRLRQVIADAGAGA